MAEASFIDDDETVLRRIPPRPDCLIRRPDIGLTATSFAIRPRPGEEFPSWSLRRITSPEELLAIEHRKGRDMSGWSVVELSVREVRSVGLDVRADPTDEDAGHCVIVPTDNQRFTGGIWSKLAKRTHVVHGDKPETFDN